MRGHRATRCNGRIADRRRRCDDFKRLGAKLRERGVSQAVHIRVWVIVNFWTHARVLDVDPANRTQLSQRSTIVMFTAQQPQFLERFGLLARAVSTEGPGLAMEMRFTPIPPNLENDPAARKLVDEGWMAKLEAIGFERAQSASPWGRGRLALPSAVAQASSEKKDSSS